MNLKERLDIIQNSISEYERKIDEKDFFNDADEEMTHRNMHNSKYTFNVLAGIKVY